MMITIKQYKKAVKKEEYIFQVSQRMMPDSPWNGCEASETKKMEGSFPAEKPRKPIRYTSWHKFLRPAHVTGHEAFESCNILLIPM